MRWRGLRWGQAGGAGGLASRRGLRPGNKQERRPAQLKRRQEAERLLKPPPAVGSRPVQVQLLVLARASLPLGRWETVRAC